MMNGERQAENPLLKLALEMGPLLLFFAANSRPQWFAPLLSLALPENLLNGPQSGIFAATAVFMPAMLVSVIASMMIVGKPPIMPLVSLFVVLVFGGLTLYLQDDHFIKMKPTIVNALFGIVLLGGLFFGRSLLSIVLNSVFQLSDLGWKKLTFRWALFFFFLAIVNEVVWRNFSTDFWVNFKVFGIMPITMIFALAQTPLIMREQTATE
ncbi:septation protein A [Terrarubrum flagellatum]|uniref:septation protein A n=1 Tax=Terrirubrum flagellatum TaxID=2895980 RepID=UPI0031451464